MGISSQAGDDTAGRPNPVCIIATLSEPADDGPVSGYPRETDSVADIALTVLEKSRRIIGIPVPTPGSEDPMARAPGKQAGQEVHREEYESAQKQQQIPEILHGVPSNGFFR